MRLKIAELQLEDEVLQEVNRQINRLEKTSPDSVEATVTRNYIDTILALPWNTETKDNLDLQNAQDILDEDHYGLKEIKERILDFISIRNLKEDGYAPILCFSGPPGVGKTSLGESIARALGRKHFRVSLGGVKDESEIRGHRRTYVGSMPGRLIQGIRKVGSKNPIIIIDELDKIGADFRGDPSAAMLEVLDPQQNKTFYDNYLGVPFDLSKAIFIATANNVDAISEPLRDRMEIISVSGYTTAEKLNIAKQHLVKRGESLSEIAHQYSVSVAQLMAWNKLKSSNHIKSGKHLIVKPLGHETKVTMQHGDGDIKGKEKINMYPTTVVAKNTKPTISKEKLVLPKTKTKPHQVLYADAKVHTVANGESLWVIANKYRTTVGNIKQLNGMRSEKLSIGQKLVVK